VRISTLSTTTIKNKRTFSREILKTLQSDINATPDAKVPRKTTLRENCRRASSGKSKMAVRPDAEQLRELERVAVDPQSTEVKNPMLL
jgi:hypothetical protein